MRDDATVTLTLTHDAMHARVRAVIHDRVLGVLFGAAVGDALGIATEFQSGADAGAFVRVNTAEHGGRLSLFDWPGRAADGSVLAEEASRHHHNFRRQKVTGVMIRISKF